MPDNDTLKSAAAFIAFVLAGLWAYFRVPNRPAPSPVLTGVGLELGSREQTERLIEQVKRIADVLEDKNQAKIEDKLEDLAEKVDAALKGRPHPRQGR